MKGIGRNRFTGKRFTRAIIDRVGHRGASLLFFALLDAVYSYSLFDPPADARTSASLAFIQDIAPLQVWGAIWGLAAVACLVSAFLIHDRWGFAGAMLVKVLWGVLFLYGAFLGVERAYLGAAIWLCLAGWVAIISSWPQPPKLEA